MIDYKWEQIKPLSGYDRNIDLAAITPLYDTWKNAKRKLKKFSPENLKTFTDRLIRRLSIETGILEHLYDLDMGTTEALVTKGFAEEFVTRTSTDIEPYRLIDILRDHEAAVQLVIDCVAGKRELTIAVIHELHAILTKHQDTTTAIDQLGNRLNIPLRKGRFKDQPNNPKRPDGAIHEYCPPIHVESEMDNLLSWLSDYGEDDPVIVASWFHHRFTQIHPYQDGNGRVARALTTLIFLRTDLLPLVIDRDLRTKYITALEKGDAGDLTSLATLFARLERSAIMEALSVDADTEIAQERKLTPAVIKNLAAKFYRRREEKDTELRLVDKLAMGLRKRTRGLLENAIGEFSNSVSQFVEPDIHITDGGPDHQNPHWYKYDVIQSNAQKGKFINFNENHYFSKASIRVDLERLVFIVSFHHVGRDLTGIMEVTAFSQLESYEQPDDRDRVSQDFFLCSLEPFVFTYQTNLEDIKTSFAHWLDAALAIALKEFGDRL